ncbi:terminase small subunit [Peptoniphilus lacrimalis]|uniref:terminase small subunit n=1 Tax=Peptoniphilus lacrimalis TaxID=33031 RepID=UPI00254C5E53|nr:terminase small subunit [Peptoniphilus lacrimalis]MDK7722502.1 terminase small subunit [Peptoniphilus lacrimalis]MDK7732109.1 terminase small subunit [Peptoniphilus lacrimalis]
MKLNARDKKFADEYIRTGKIIESAIKAGFAESTARDRAAEWLNPNSKSAKLSVLEYINELNKKIEKEKIADAKEIQEFWTKTFRDEKVEIKDRIKTSELLARVQGMFIENINLTGNIKTNNPFDGLSVEELRKLIKSD